MGFKKSVGLVMTIGAVAAIAGSASSASAAGVCSPSTPQYCPAPAVTTAAATGITTSSATLNGTVNPQGAPTECVYAYGKTTTYTASTSIQSVGQGTSSVAVPAPISGLSATTPYHFQLICVNSADSFGYGGDKTFTTLSTTVKVRSKVGFGTRKETVSKKRIVKFIVICKSTTVACKGTLTLKSSGKKLANAVRYSIGAGKRKTISMKLTKKAFKKLKHAKHHKRTARVKATDNDGASASKSVTLKLV